MGIYIVYYTVVRYLMQMLRGDEVRGNVGGISTSQIISIILIPVGIVLVRGKWLERKLEKSVELAGTDIMENGELEEHED